MRKLALTIILAIGLAVTTNAQDKMTKNSPKIISLEQTSGEFTQKQITVSNGTYVFEISNNAVGHDVGFVLVKKGKDISKSENHIQTAYVTTAVATGKKQRSKAITLNKGEYVYFCPLNPTSTDNTLIVK